MPPARRSIHTDDAPPVDRQRRRALAATAALGGAGAAALAATFAASLMPSARAIADAAPVSFDPAGLRPGDLSVVAWQGKPVWIMRRTEDMVRALQQPNDALVDPTSDHSAQPPGCRNATRSLRPDLFVAVGICTHLGCSPVLRVSDATIDAEVNGPGGFLCPCHGSVFDLAGRVIKNVPAPTNLDVPPHTISESGLIVVG